MNVLRRSSIWSALGLTGAYTNMKVAELDPRTRRFPTRVAASVVTSAGVDLDKYKSLLLMPESDFVHGQIAKINYFDETMTVEQLEAAIVRHGLSDLIPSVQDKIGINLAYSAYKPFLWLRFKIRKESRKVFAQFVLIKPDDLQELFVVEQSLDYAAAGVNDQNTWYPMFNALIDYIDRNSKVRSGQAVAETLIAAA